MRKKHFCNRLVLFIMLHSLTMLFLLTPTALAQNSRPQQDCCFLIWSTARYLGWSTALFFNTQIRERWVQYDWTMVEQLEGAMHSIKGVERSCSEARWDDCEEKILWLQNLIRSFQKNPTSGNRRSIFNAILNTYKWGIQLKRQVYHYQGQTYETAFSTCAEKYYSLGFCLATAAQLFRHADENARLRGRKWQWWYDQNILSARSWLQEAQAVLGGYREVTTGECVALPVQSYYNIITDIKRSANRQQNLQSWIQGVEKVMNDAGQRLRMQCSAGNFRNRTGKEICGDGIDNNGNNEIDEGCKFSREIVIDDNECPDDTIRLYVDGRNYGNNPAGHKRHYNVSGLSWGEHEIEIYGVESGGDKYKDEDGKPCNNSNTITISIELGEGINFAGGGKSRSKDIKEGKSKKFTVVVK